MSDHGRLSFSKSKGHIFLLALMCSNHVSILHDTSLLLDIKSISCYRATLC